MDTSIGNYQDQCLEDYCLEANYRTGTVSLILDKQSDYKRVAHTLTNKLQVLFRCFEVLKVSQVFIMLASIM